MYNDLQKQTDFVLIDNISDLFFLFVIILIQTFYLREFSHSPIHDKINMKYKKT